MPTSRIRSHWETILRVAGTLITRRAAPSEVVRILSGAGGQSVYGRAIVHVGRVAKTVHTLRLARDTGYRRTIRVQLNRTERRHGLAREVFFGRSGLLKQPHRTGQEDQIGTLGLLLIMIVLWNTRYLDAALLEHRRMGGGGDDSDAARLSPICREHINFVGRYDFALPDEVRRGQLRPLRGA